MLPPTFQPAYISVTCHDDVAVVTFASAELTDEDNLEILGRELFCLVDQFGCRKIVLDMQGLHYVSSSVLGKIITLHRKLQREGGQLILSQLEQGLRETLQTSRLISYFHIAEDVQKARQQMTPPADRTGPEPE